MLYHENSLKGICIFRLNKIQAKKTGYPLLILIDNVRVQMHNILKMKKLVISLPCFKSSTVKCFRGSNVFGQTKSIAVSGSNIFDNLFNKFFLFSANSS